MLAPYPAGRRENREESNHHATVMPARSDMLAAQPGEGTDVVRKQDISPAGRRTKTSTLKDLAHPELRVEFGGILNVTNQRPHDRWQRASCFSSWPGGR